MTNDSKPIPTFQLPFLLAQQFIRDYNEVIKYFKADEKLILTEYLLQILSLKLDYQKSKDETLYQQYNKSEEDLKRQFWQVLKPCKDEKKFIFILMQT